MFFYYNQKMPSKKKTPSALKQPDHVAWRKVENEAVLLDLKTGEYFTLNEIGSLVWERLCAGDSLAAITARICRDYAVKPAQADGDVQSLVDRLLKKKLLAAS